MPEQFLVAPRAFGHLARLADDDDGWHRLRLLAQGLQQRHEDVVQQQHAGTAVGQRKGKFVHAPAAIERRQHGAEPPCGVDHGQKAVGVGRQHEHAVAAAHARGVQAARQLRDLRMQLRVGGAPVAADGGQPVGIFTACLV